MLWYSTKTVFAAADKIWSSVFLIIGFSFFILTNSSIIFIEDILTLNLYTIFKWTVSNLL